MQLLKAALRLLGIAALVAAFAGWIWFTSVMIEMKLDYPQKWAYYEPDYPARDSAAFYLICIKEIGLAMVASSWAWGLPVLVALWLAVKVFPKFRGWKLWTVAVSGLLLPVIGWMIYELFFIPPFGGTYSKPPRAGGPVRQTDVR